MVSVSQMSTTKDVSINRTINAATITRSNINLSTYILEDPDHSFSIGDVIKLDADFKPIKKNVLNLGLSDKQYWLMFNVDFSGVEQGERFHLTQLHPYIYEMSLYSPSITGHQQTKIQLLESWDQRPYQSNLPSFDIVAGPNPQSTYYLRVHGGTGFPIQLSLELAQTKQFLETIQTNSLFDGFFYGTALAFLVYSFLLLLQLRDKPYRLYCGYLLFTILTFLVYDNYITAHFNFSLTQYYFVILLPNIQFNMAFRHALVMLNTKENLSKFHGILSFVNKFHSIAIPFFGLMPPEYSIPVTFLFFNFYIGFFAIYMFFSYEKLKIVYLRLYVIGWILPLIFGVAFAASLLDLFLDPIFAFKLVKVGIVWQAIFSSMSIAEQINSTRVAIESIGKEKVIAEKTAQMKSDFLANMSHELRDPMNRVVGYSSQALSEASPIEKDKFLVKVAENSAHLLNTINNILDFSKMDYGKFQLRNEVFSITDLTQRLTQYFPESSNKIKFTITENTSSGFYIGDPHGLFRVLVNLIGNAFKFTQQGYISLIITERLLETDSLSGKTNCILTFEVSDSGIGIEEKKITRLFQPFEQADFSSTRQYEGTGLGLSISNSLTDLMEGTIEVKSALGKGSTFIVTLPFTATDDPLSLAENSFGMFDITQSKNAEAIVDSTRILLVDDSELNLEFMKNYLVDKVALTDTAKNGIEAIAKVLRHDYDLILMDVQMAKMDGYEATEKIRKLGHTKLPIVALSAATTSTDEHRSIAAGMNDFICKPVDFIELHKKINHWVNFSRSDGSTIHSTSEQLIHPNHLNTDHLDINHRDADNLDKVFSSQKQRLEFIVRSHRNLLQIVSRIDVLEKDDLASEDNNTALQRLAHEGQSIAGNIGLNQLGTLLDFISHHLPDLPENDRHFVIKLLLENKLKLKQ